MPIGQGRVYCYCDAPATGAPRRPGEDPRRWLTECLAGFAAPVPAILDALGRTDAVHVAPIEEVTLNGWSRGSVLLIGDAAHATSPNMAEGAAMALEDANVLAECLASEPALAAAVAAFQHRRAPVPVGSKPRRTAAIAPAACRPRSATWCCARGDGASSTPTTVHFWNSRDGTDTRPAPRYCSSLPTTCRRMSLLRP